MNYLHLVYIPFRGVGVKNGDDEWFAKRIEIFKQYTWKSLLNQTNQDFIVWLSFRPEDFDSPLIHEILKDIPIKWRMGKFVITFDGLMYHDDKNLEANKTLEQRLTKSLNFWKEGISKKYDYILMTRLDSDDMLRKDAIQEIQNRVKWDDMDWDIAPQALVFMRGLVYNTETRELAEWRPRTNPPFHTIIFPSHVFFNAKEHLEFYGDWTSHEDTILQWNFAKLSDYKYCVTVRPNGHISTHFNHPFRGKMITENKEQILKDFGLWLLRDR